MTVKRIVSNINTTDIQAAKRFYQDVLGLDLRALGSKEILRPRSFWQAS